MSTSSTKRKAGDTQVIGNDEEDKTHKQEQDRQILENVMSINRRKRIAETQFINKHEANQICKEKEGEEGCQTMGGCCNPELPSHIVIDILSRLPMKSLFNFRCVCKEWLSLISDPHFANLHLSKSQLSLLLKPSAGKRRSWKLNLVDLKTTPRIRPRNARKEFVTKINLPKGPNIPCNIINSCNGLLCLFDESDFGPRSDGPICICNPLLGELVTLPKSPSVRPMSDLLSCAAFGYSPMTDQYKVVRSFRSCVIGRVTDREMWEAEIYTLGEGSWRSIGKIPTMVQSYSFNAFLNGSLHWLSHALSEDFIYCFDFGSEQFGAVPEPFEFGRPVHRECSDYMYVGVLQGCLSICDFGQGGVAEVWVMKDYGVKESWSKEFVLENMMIDGCPFRYYEPILILDGGQILIFEHNAYSILLYDPGSNCLRNVHTFGYSGTCFFGLAHVPSLLSLVNVAKGENFKKFNCLKETGSSSKKDG